MSGEDLTSIKFWSRGRAVAPVLLLLGLIFGQWLLFAQFVQREVAWSYPATFDQAVFLARSYEISDRIASRGPAEGLLWGAGFRGGTTIANGAVLHIQAALLHGLFRPSRLGALSINFIHFALLQGMLAYALYWLTRSWAVAFAGIGLLLTAHMPFLATGGIADFRMDFGAACLMGMFLCCVMRSRLFLCRGWSLAAGIVLAYTIAYRFLTAAEIVPILGILLAWLCLAALVLRRDARERERGRAFTAGDVRAILPSAAWSRGSPSRRC